MIARKLTTRVAPLFLFFPSIALTTCAGAAGNALKGEPGPPSVTVQCDDTSIRIDGPKFWTVSRLMYRGVMLGIEDSAYGSVYRFPNGVDIGSAHVTGDEKEIVTQLQYFLDGKLVPSPQSYLQGKQFKLHKKSLIRDISLDTLVEVKNNHIFETVVAHNDKEVVVDTVYHSMHAWTPTATAFIAAKDGETELGEDLRDGPEVDRKFYIRQPIDWFSIYDGQSHKGVVLRLLEKPSFGTNSFQLWNVPGIYRKLYFVANDKQNLPAGFTGRYRMVTTFFDAEPQEWKSIARKIQKELKKYR